MKRTADTHQLAFDFNGAPLMHVNLIRDMTHTYLPRIPVRSPENVAIFLKDHFSDKATEEFVTLNLNTPTASSTSPRPAVAASLHPLWNPERLFAI